MAEAQGYTEGADLSSNPAAPTPVTMGLGTNTVTGSVLASTDTPDYLITVAPAPVQSFGSGWAALLMGALLAIGALIAGPRVRRFS